MHSTDPVEAETICSVDDPDQDQPQIQPFLAPGALDDRKRRWHKIILASLMAFGMLKGAYWAALTPVWSPVDEAQHFGYVESLARGNGIPTVGVDLLSDDVMASLKTSTTMLFRSHPHEPTASSTGWGSTRHQYEAIHGPTYYALMVPAYWAGAPFGTSGSLLAIRLATALLAVLALPLVWLLARRLFPDDPTIWLLSAAVLVVIDASSPGMVNNDTMVLVVGMGAMVLLLRSLDDPRKLTPAIWFGVLGSATIITKTTSLVLIPLSALIIITWLIRRRPPLGVTLRWFGVTGAAAVITMAPWVGWNYHSYGAPSAAERVSEVTEGNHGPDLEFSRAAIESHYRGARDSGFWNNPFIFASDYTPYWEKFGTIALVLGVAGAMLRRRWRDLAALLWCAVALPLAFIALETIVWVVFNGTGGPSGRHLILAMGPTSIMFAAAGVIALREHWGAAAITSGLAGALVIAVPAQHNSIKFHYLYDVRDGNLAPVLTQTWSDGLKSISSLHIKPDCPTRAIALGFSNDTPNSISVKSEEGQEFTALVDVSTINADMGTIPRPPTFIFPESISSSFDISIDPPMPINTSNEDLAPWMNANDATGDPVVLIFCQVANADEVAFEATYTANHPAWITLTTLRNIPIVFAVIGSIASFWTVTWAAATTYANHSARRRDSSQTNEATRSQRSDH